MNYLYISLDWENTYCSDITIGVKTVPIYFLERYYRGLHLYDLQAYRTARYLFSLGIEAVIKQGIFKRQLDVDRTFFGAILRSCEPAFRDWVQNWKDVFIQLSTSRVRFKDFIIRQGNTNMTKRQYNDMMDEVKNIKRFFRVLNMPRAFRLMSIFSDTLHWQYGDVYCSVPDVYPFALKGKPGTAVAQVLRQEGSSIEVLTKQAA